MQKNVHTDDDLTALSDRMDTLRDEMRDLARLTKRTARHGLEEAADRGSHYLENARERVSEAGETVSDAVREHPYRSLLIAAGGGLVLGMLVKR